MLSTTSSRSTTAADRPASATRREHRRRPCSCPDAIGPVMTTRAPTSQTLARATFRQMGRAGARDSSPSTRPPWSPRCRCRFRSGAHPLTELLGAVAGEISEGHRAVVDGQHQRLRRSPPRRGPSPTVQSRSVAANRRPAVRRAGMKPRALPPQTKSSTVRRPSGSSDDGSPSGRSMSRVCTKTSTSGRDGTDHRQREALRRQLPVAGGQRHGILPAVLPGDPVGEAVEAAGLRPPPAGTGAAGGPGCSPGGRRRPAPASRRTATPCPTGPRRSPPDDRSGPGAAP